MMRRELLGGAVALAIAAVAALAWPVRAAEDGERAAKKPIVVRFVDIGKVLKGSKRAQEVEGALNERRTAIQGAFETGRKAIIDRARTLDSMDPESAKYREEKAAIKRDEFLLKLETDSKMEQLEHDAHDEMASIYVAIRKVTAEYAKAHGIDAVFTYDLGKPTGRTFQEIKFEMAVRPVLFARADLDVSKEITDALNKKS